MNKKEPKVVDEITSWIRGKLENKEFQDYIKRIHEEIASVDPDCKTHLPEVERAEVEKRSAAMIALLSMWAGDFGIHFNKLDNLPRKKRTERMCNYLINAYKEGSVDWEVVFGMTLRHDERNRIRESIKGVGRWLLLPFVHMF